MSDGGANNFDQPRAPAWIWLALLTAVVFGYIGFRRWNESRADQSKRQADLTWSVQDLAAKPSTLESFRGRTIFLNVWATWCPPCVAEFPLIAELASRPDLKNVDFVCVSVDDELDPVAAFVEKRRPLPMSIFHARAAAPAVFATDGIPATFVIAPDGRIVRKQIGMIAESQAADFAKLLAELSGAPSTGN
jgi:thiol-disulfide isomerase/thioredoxin